MQILHHHFYENFNTCKFCKLYFSLIKMKLKFSLLLNWICCHDTHRQGEGISLFIESESCCLLAPRLLLVYMTSVRRWGIEFRLRLGVENCFWLEYKEKFLERFPRHQKKNSKASNITFNSPHYSLAPANHRQSSSL